jgi:enolase
MFRDSDPKRYLGKGVLGAVRNVGLKSRMNWLDTTQRKKRESIGY